MSSKVPADTITSPHATPNATITSKTPGPGAALTNTELSAQTPPPKGQQSTLQEIHQDNDQGISTDTSDSQQSGITQGLDVPQNDVFIPIQQLSESEALQEEERASEKIRQKLRPLFKLNATRRNIVNQEIASSFSHPTSRHFYPPEPDINIPDPSYQPDDRGSTSHHGQLESVFSVESSIAGSVVEGSIRSRSKVKIGAKAHKKPIPLIEIEPAKLVDAETAPGDRRYFQRPGDYKLEGDFVYDFLYQHQRGVFIFGTPKFSSKSLLPVDPDEWTDDRFETSLMDITDFAVPDPTWEWVHKTWLVDMTGDVDEDGWEYAMTFHGSPWHGKPGPLPERTYPASINSATWTKLDVSQYLDDPSPFLPDDPSDDSSDENLQPHLLRPPKHLDPVDLFKILKKARSDREKLAYTAQYVVRYPGHLVDLEKRSAEYLNLFDYETSRREFLSLLVAYSGAKTEAIEESASHLEFFSDRKKLNLK
ncbi:hypothetical protein BGX26_003829 [Mortierella sp. AD094]|nr:hypothetical protein BGX26_003829 [Mortierella sp. AD094]